MRYKFFESKFGGNFCRGKVQKLKKLIDSSACFTVIGMPGVGVTIFLKYLATTDLAHFIYVDSYLLADLTKEEFFKLLFKELGGDVESGNQIFEKCLKKLEELTQKHDKVVLIFNRFDQLKSIFDANFFGNIWALRHVNREKIVIISTANKSLSEIAPEALNAGNQEIFSRIVHFRPFLPEDLEVIASIYEQNNLIENPQAISLAKNLSGGNYQLLQLLLKSARLSNPLQDRFIQLQLKELFEFVSFKQRRILQKIASGKRVDFVDEYLVEIGLIKKLVRGYELFTPLLSEYIVHHHPKRLPLKEAKLFKLLKQHLGKVVEKEEIFSVLWPEDSKEYDKASEWALNSLIYRLKKNHTFITSGYHLENHKKEGYILFKD